ncbi:MAG TPA: class I SAM-dependent methyltransferase [Coriobacteriia bacterium]|nr:class I SAM-dependent methyltransferase [Coriobacteriia bacterium]
MSAYRFDPAKLDKLNDVARLDDLVPDLMWESFGVPDATTVVEIGAGTGMFAREFAERMPDDGTLLAVDSEPLMVAWMTEHLSPGPGARITPVLADASALPLSAKEADLVYSVNLWHELEDHAAALAETMRVLAPGGVVAVVDWKAEETPKGPPLAHRRSAEGIVRALQEAGFTDARIHPPLRYHSVVTGRRS